MTKYSKRIEERIIYHQYHISPESNFSSLRREEKIWKAQGKKKLICQVPTKDTQQWLAFAECQKLGTQQTILCRVS